MWAEFAFIKEKETCWNILRDYFVSESALRVCMGFAYFETYLHKTL